MANSKSITLLKGSTHNVVHESYNHLGRAAVPNTSELIFAVHTSWQIIVIPGDQILGCIFCRHFPYLLPGPETNQPNYDWIDINKTIRIYLFLCLSQVPSNQLQKKKCPQHPNPRQPDHRIHPCFLRRFVSFFFPPRISSKSNSLVPTLTFFNLEDGRGCTPWVYTPFNQQDIAL